ncbi:DUF11 domain-containing protein [Pseudanabaena mucicola]|uniref:DUF11 domain-containing protein n=1 Tax=Pseudanabaena mucicola FACHB-723 TaxID=2692860 RepID=A0ABR8A001_9CYAN|nr:DUF11 domain-containing protein [Pseudanabaena mucicola]MBD2189075.1 DUF11 domain-containing protein [Pseudanabaena mucicola FACHB-723]
MKSIHLIGLGAIALISSISFANVTPMFASLQRSEPAIAQTTAKQEAPIQLQLTAEKKSLLAVASGTVEWKALPNNASLRPGETVRYVVTASNTSDRNIKKLVVTQPIPKSSIYVLGSATLPNIQGVKVDYSIDGGKTYTATPTIRVKNEKGEIVTVPAPDNMYTHVRWNFGDNFPAKTAVNATYQVRIR